MRLVALQRVRAVIVDEDSVKTLPLELRERPKVIMTATGLARSEDHETRILGKPFIAAELEDALAWLMRSTDPEIGPEFHSGSGASVRSSSGPM